MERWTSSLTFVMATIGYAVGLGNMWRFPYMTASYGGATFLLVYVFAMLCVGIPVMLAEFWLGNSTQKPANLALATIRKGFSFIGWLGVFTMFFIITYYSYATTWILSYIFHAPSIATWGASGDTSKEFFFNHVLQLSKGPFSLSGVNGPLAISSVVLWLMVIYVTGTTQKVFERAINISVPLVFIFLIVLAGEGLSLDGASKGLTFYLKPDFSKIWDASVWSGAFGQAFFSLSLGIVSLATFSFQLPKGMNYSRLTISTVLGDFFVAFLGGIVIFSIMGHLSSLTGGEIKNDSGPGLVFVAYPIALAKLPLAGLFATTFYVVLFLLAFSSIIGLIRAIAIPFSTTFHWNYKKTAITISVLGFICSLPFSFGGGLYWLDIIDHFLTGQMMPFIGLVECLIIGYVVGIKKVLKEVNETSGIKMGFLTGFCIKFLNPILLAYLLITQTNKDLSKPYGDYSTGALLLFGGGFFVVSIVLSYLFYKKERAIKKLSKVND